MPFDPSTATPVEQGFDPETAQPVPVHDQAKIDATEHLSKYLSGDPAITKHDADMLHTVTRLSDELNQAFSSESTADDNQPWWLRTAKSVIGGGYKAGELVKNAVSSIPEKISDISSSVSKFPGLSWGDKPEDWKDFAQPVPELVQGAATAIGSLPAQAAQIAAGASELNPATQLQETAEYLSGNRGPALTQAAQNRSIADIIQHYTSTGANDISNITGISNDTLAAHLGNLIGYSAIPFADLGTAEAAANAVKNATGLLGNAVGGARYAAIKSAPTVVGAAKAGTVDMALRKMGLSNGLDELMSFWAGFGGKSGVGNKEVANKISQWATGKSLQEISDDAALVASKPMGMTANEARAAALRQTSDNLGREADGLFNDLDTSDKLKATAKNPDGSYTYDIDSLSKDAKVVRQKMLDRQDLTDKSSALITRNKLQKIWDDVIVQGAGNTLFHAVQGAGAGAGFSASTAPTGQTDQSVAQGATLGGVLGLVGAPMSFYTGERAIKARIGRDALISRAQSADNVKGNLDGLTDKAKQYIYTIAGQADALGGKKIYVQTPSELRQAGGLSPTADPGFGFVHGETGDIYLNKDALGSGVAGHELTHVTQDFFGKMLRNASPEVMKDFEERYQKALDKTDNKTFDSQSERDAEIGRLVLNHTPIEMFYGGEAAKTGVDIVKDIFDGLSGKNGYQFMGGFRVPVSGADTAEMKQRLYKAGEIAARPGRVDQFEGQIPPPVTPDQWTPEQKARANELVAQGVPTDQAMKQVNDEFRNLPQFMPRTPDSDLEKVIHDYTGKAGINYVPHQDYRPINEGYSKSIADLYDTQPHDPNNPKVKAGYDAFWNAIKDQYHTLVKHGYTIEPWPHEGQPYANSADMLKDLRGNKHLYYFETERGYGEKGGETPSDHPMLQGSGVYFNGKEALRNDIFRGVHDALGHGVMGWQFGPRGEYNAFLTHASTLPHEAWGALATETLGQNSWTNFGRHMRNDEGNIIQPGEKGYLPITERPYTRQRANLLNFMPPIDPIRAEEARGNSRPVSLDEYHALAREGLGRLSRLTRGSWSTQGLEQNWDKIKNDSFDVTREPWGGITIDPRTGKGVSPTPSKSGGPYAMSARGPDQPTVSIPEGSTPLEFFNAMDRAREQFKQIGMRGIHLGVFHDNATKSIDIDPILMLDSPRDVETIGAYTRAVGGAYDFSTGNGHFPPHVADTGARPAYMPAVSKELPPRFYVHKRIGHHDAIVDRLTGEIVDTWEGSDPGEYSSSTGYSSAQEQADSENSERPPLPPSWTGSHPEAFIPEVIRKQPDGTWGIEGPKNTVIGSFKTSEEANKALEESHRQIYNPNEPFRISDNATDLQIVDDPTNKGRYQVINSKTGKLVNYSLPLNVAQDIVNRSKHPLFMPSVHPDAIESAAIKRKSDNRIFTPASSHLPHYMIPQSNPEAQDYLGSNGHNLYDEGFVNKKGEFQDRTKALETMKSLGQLPESYQPEYKDELNVTGLNKYMPAARDMWDATPPKNRQDLESSRGLSPGSASKNFHDLSPEDQQKLAQWFPQAQYMPAGRPLSNEVSWLDRHGNFTPVVMGHAAQAVEMLGGNMRGTEAASKIFNNGYMRVSFHGDTLYANTLGEHQLTHPQKQALVKLAEDTNKSSVVFYSGENKEQTIWNRNQYMPSWVPKGMRKNITPEEEHVLENTQKAEERFFKIAKNAPPITQGMKYAQLADKQKNWYDNSAQAIVDIFGNDSDRFAALLAATSPNTAVEPNMEVALHTWDKWNDAGRPTDKTDVLNVLEDGIADAMTYLRNQGKTNLARHSGASTYLNNVHRALSADDPSPTKLRLSGPKAGSFHSNLTNSMEMLREVTNDRHIAKYITGRSDVDSRLYGVRRRTIGGENKSTKTPEYIATSAHIREVANRLTKLTGETWTPRQAQAAIWSYVLQKEGRGSGAKSVDVNESPGFDARLREYQDALQNPF